MYIYVLLLGVTPEKLKNTGKVSLLTGKPIKMKAKAKSRQVDQVRIEISELEKKIKALKDKKTKTEASMQAAIKFPVPDEEIMKADPKGNKPKDLPKPMGALSVPDDIAHDVLMIWDCVFVFQKQLRLTEIVLDDFCDLLLWTDYSCVALTELCVALLRVILDDTRLVHIYIHIHTYVYVLYQNINITFHITHCTGETYQ